jgi:hypothetical protein
MWYLEIYEGSTLVFYGDYYNTKAEAEEAASVLRREEGYRVLVVYEGN